MIRDESGLVIFAIAFCNNCELYTPLFNERTIPIDAERKLGNHAANEHDHKRDGMGWTKDERDMSGIRNNPSFRKGNL